MVYHNFLHQFSLFLGDIMYSDERPEDSDVRNANNPHISDVPLNSNRCRPVSSSILIAASLFMVFYETMGMVLVLNSQNARLIYSRCKRQNLERSSSLAASSSACFLALIILALDF